MNADISLPLCLGLLTLRWTHNRASIQYKGIPGTLVPDDFPCQREHCPLERVESLYGPLSLLRNRNAD